MKIKVLWKCVRGTYQSIIHHNHLISANDAKEPSQEALKTLTAPAYS